MNERLDVINHEQLRTTIKKCYQTGRALFVRGAPGIGKSQHIEEVEKEIAKEEKREFFNWNESTEKQKQELKNPETLKKTFIFAIERISLCDPSDLKGLPQLNGGEYMKWISPLLYKIASMEEFRGCIFFDEMNTAPPLTQNTSMHIVLDKQLADLSLNKHLQIIAAGNRCLTSRHYVMMADEKRQREKYKAIDSIKIGDKVISYGKRGFECDEVTNVSKRKVYNTPIYTFVTENNHRLETTHNHPILTTKGWKWAEQIKQGDIILENPEFDKKKISGAKTGRIPSERKNKCGGCNREFLSDRKMGACSKSCAARMVTHYPGHKQSDISKQKISKRLNELYATGQKVGKNPFEGKSEEEIRQMKIKRGNISRERFKTSIKMQKHLEQLKILGTKALLKWKKENPEMVIKMGRKGALNLRKSGFVEQDTKIEIIMEGILKEIGVEFKKKKSLVQYGELVTIPDFIFPQKQIAIYCDGEYWHKQPKIHNRDEKQMEILKTYNWKVLRFWGKDIMNNAERIKDEIKCAVTNGEQVKEIKIIKRTCWVYDLSIKKNKNFVANGLIVHNCEDRGHTFEMPLPLLNRFMHCELGNPSVEQWTSWALKHEIDEKIIAYINFKQDHLFMITKDSEEWAFPTPRTNAFLSQQIKGETDERTIKTLTAQAVGNSYAMSFMAFIKLSYTIKLKDVIENPEKELKKLEKEEQEKSIGIKWSLTSALAEYYRNNTKDMGKVLNVCTYLEPEFARLVLRFCRQADPRGTETFDKMMTKTPEFAKHAMILEKYLF